MAEYSTLSGMLAAQGERKLVKLREGIVEEIDRLRIELKIVDDALGRKRRDKTTVENSDRSSRQTSGSNAGEGLPRTVLMAHIRDIGQREVTPSDVQAYLTLRGVDRSIEAIRTAMGRLARDGALERENGHFVVLPSDDGERVGPGGPLWGTEPDMEGVATPDE